MSRTVMGPKLGLISIPAPTVAAAIAVAAGGTAAAKLDPKPIAGQVHHDGKPFAVEFLIPPYDLATHNKLIAITVVMVPANHGEPVNPDDFMRSSYPKGTLDTSAIGNGTAPAAAIPALPSVAAAVGTDPTPVAADPAVAASAATAPAAGELVKVEVPSVPAGDHVGQVLLTYDV